MICIITITLPRAHHMVSCDNNHALLHGIFYQWIPCSQGKAIVSGSAAISLCNNVSYSRFHNVTSVSADVTGDRGQNGVVQSITQGNSIRCIIVIIVFERIN